MSSPPQRVVTAHFGNALRDVIGQLNLTFDQFGKAVDLSQPMVSKLTAGKRGHQSTYRRILAFVTDQPRGKELVSRLWEGFIRDMAEEFGYAQHGKLPSRVVAPGSSTKALAGELFADFPVPVVLALCALGTAATRDDNVHNELMATAERVSHLLGGGARGYFTAQIRRSPQEKQWRLLGGSLGDLLMKLNAEKDENPEGGESQEASQDASL